MLNVGQLPIAWGYAGAMGDTRVYVYGPLHRSGFVKRLKVSICQAMILLTWATILKIFALACFAGGNPR